MKFHARWLILGVLTAVILPCLRSVAQSDDGNSVPLGDIARALRKQKEQKEKNAAQPEPPSARTVINNDNFSQVMAQAEKDRLKGNMKFLFDGVGKDIHVAAPDVTCSLAFNAKTGALVSDPFVSQDLPRNELVKLDGPANISEDALQVTIHNNTGWMLREITVSLTIVRPPETKTAAQWGAAKLVPAAAKEKEEEPAGKPSDFTVLYHIKGAASPFATGVFHQDIGGKLDADQEWHWAIVQAQGIPPQPPAPEAATQP